MMTGCRRIFLILLLLCNWLNSSVRGQCNNCYGLSFQSFTVAQEKRTSLTIGAKNPICLGNDFSLDFDLSFAPNQNIYFGYIYRLVNQSGQRINFLFDQKNNRFRLTVDGKYASVDFPITGDSLYGKWNHFKFHFDNDSLSCQLNGSSLSKSFFKLKDHCFTLVFGGGSDGQFNTTDVPPMRLRDVTIRQNKKVRYAWPLRIGSMGITLDAEGGEQALVNNPVWLLQLHSHWQLLDEKVYQGNASVAFDPDKEQLYILSEDSLYRFTFNSNQPPQQDVYPSKGYHLFLGNHLVYNTRNQTLYDFYTDIHSIAAYSFSKGTWNKSYDTVEHTEYSQANRIYSPQEDALYVIGGYGQMRYKNSIQRYSFSGNRWETLIPKGAFFTPRYLASAAREGDSIYILGGYGSPTGDQMLNPGYVYDFMVYNTRNNRFTKRFTLNSPDSARVFGSSMIIDTAEGSYYAFGFSNERYDSKLQLLKGSLYKPDYHPVGDKIPFPFKDVLSEANLFWCPKSQSLLAVTLITDPDKTTAVAIYNIAFPPNLLSKAPTVPVSAFSQFLRRFGGWLLLGVILVIILFVSRRIYKKYGSNGKKGSDNRSRESNSEKKEAIQAAQTDEWEKQSLTKPPIITPEENPTFVAPPFKDGDRLTETDVANLDLLEEDIQVGGSIYLFGTFEVIDEEGQYLTAQFSPLLKELFLIILLNSIVQRTGISSKKLNEIFWHSKSDKDANNNRSVNIAKLKNIIDKIPSLAVSNVNGKWLVQFDPEKVNIDLVVFQELAASDSPVDKHKVRRMLFYLKRGALLKHTEYDWLDDIKSRISNLVIDQLGQAAHSLDQSKDADLILELGNCIFFFDPINELALSLKCKSLAAIGRHSLAQSTYQHYCKEYQKMYGEQFALSFNDIVSG